MRGIEWITVALLAETLVAVAGPTLALQMPQNL